ncbi:MAG: glycosyl hydrolase family 28-related protein, partial [Cyanobacteria bacterium J06641_2]
MKSQKVKLLLGLITLTTSSLLTLIVLSNKSLNKITTKQEGVEDTHNSVNLVSQESSESSKVVSVKDFGAIGDGTKDDTSAIQKAIDDVYNAGGGVVNFPSGTYKVTINPNSGQAITIRPKIILQGTSNQDSIIKLADGQGNYNSMLAGERLESDLSDFAMYDLAIDGNGENNPVNAESDLGRLTMRHSLRIYRGSRITIDRCRFINQNNANTITLNGIIFDITINNNIFEFIGGGEADYDHSTIYTHSHTNGKRIEIANNSFSSKNGAGTNGARTAIETHGDEHTVKDNVIREYAFGINVAGYSKSGSSDNLTITGNEIKGVYGGIVIWSY